MRRTRQILVLTLVATALCADRVTSEMAQIRAPFSAAVDPISRLATKLACRLSGTFRRETQRVCLEPIRREETTFVATVEVPAAPAAIHQIEGSPFQFRLPPPAL